MKKINLYGTGVKAAEFLLLHKEIEINKVIEGKAEKALRNPFFGGHRVIMLDDAMPDIKGYYTVVAASECAYWEIKRKLEIVYGLVEYEDFEYYLTFQKKRVFIYGNCHTALVKWALQSSAFFSANYGIYPLPQIQEIRRETNRGRLWDGIDSFSFDRCEVFIHQCIRDNNSYGEEYGSNNIICKLPTSCQIIGIPNLYQMPKFLFPQIPDEFDQVYYDVFGSSCFFAFRDRFIDENITRSIEDIYEMMEDPSLIDASKIREEEEAFFEKLRDREKQWDFNVSEFLSKKIIEEQCFYDPNHPTNNVMNYIIRKLFETMNLGCVPDLSSMMRLSSHELPMYKSVFDALNLKYYPDFIRRDGYLKLRDVEMDKKEYIREYLLWNYSGYPYTIKHINYNNKPVLVTK